MEEGTPNDEPLEGVMMPAPDRLWRHPAERGAEQAAANLAARRVYGRRWPSMLMSFIAGCTVVATAWIFQNEPRTPIVEGPTVYEIAPSTQPVVAGPISLNTWAEEVAQINSTSIVGLQLGGNPRHEMAQAILLTDDGHLITSAHALLGADSELITAVLPDGKQIPAKLVGSDSVSGVAVLKVTSPELPPPTYGDELQVLAGDRLVALAHQPDATRSTVRTIDLLGKEHVASLPNDDLLSGLFRLSDDLEDWWSGAAILDEDGGIVAMAVESRTGGHFAIPTKLARQVAREIIEVGVVDHKAWLGVDGLVELSDGIKQQRGLLGGLLILRVWDETPAAKAGLVAGDIIVGAGTVNVLDRTDLRLVMATLDPGDTIELRYSRSTPTITPQDGTPQDRMTYETPRVDSEIYTTSVTVGAAPNS